MIGCFSPRAYFGEYKRKKDVYKYLDFKTVKCSINFYLVLFNQKLNYLSTFKNSKYVNLVKKKSMPFILKA